ncbi:MAG TPA: uracil-DNA glycosylase [Archaeoglobaceae archaeon]|nr:uracil-DNA glycosylase [Archaeoglobaceae archaeon]
MKSLKEITKEILSCKKCDLWKTNTNYVPGEGDASSRIVFVGEAPGREEDIQGRPFVGAAGKLLTQMIEKVIGLERRNVFITNILKCRPPDNRDPLPEEINACTPHLLKQLEAIKPDVIVCLGRHSASYIFRVFGLKFPGISRAKGVVKEVDGVKIIAIYHPAAILYRPQLKEDYERDFRKIASLVKENKKKTLLDFL